MEQRVFISANQRGTSTSSPSLAVLPPPRTYSYRTRFPSSLVGRPNKTSKATAVGKQTLLAKKSTDLFNIPRQSGTGLALGAHLREVHSTILSSRAGILAVQWKHTFTVFPNPLPLQTSYITANQ